MAGPARHLRELHVPPAVPLPVHQAPGWTGVPDRIRMPRWTFALAGRRVRMSAGMATLLAASAGAVLWWPAQPLVWVPLATVLGVAVSTLVHEGAHALVAHVLGYRVDWVVVGGLVGTTAYEGRDDRPLERAAVAMAGPAATAALVLALLAVRALLRPGEPAMVATEAALGLNAMSLAVNLVPVGGTDGGLLVRALAEHRRSLRWVGAVPIPAVPAAAPVGAAVPGVFVPGVPAAAPVGAAVPGVFVPGVPAAAPVGAAVPGAGEPGVLLTGAAAVAPAGAAVGGVPVPAPVGVPVPGVGVPAPFAGTARQG